MASKSPNSSPYEELQLPFGDEVAPALTETEQAIARGTETARQFMEDPNSFGSDWPTAQMNRRYRESMATQAATPTESSPVEYTTERAKIGSRAQSELNRPAVQAEKEIVESTYANPEGRSKAAKRVQDDADSRWIRAHL